jgi:hypothetical protein
MLLAGVVLVITCLSAMAEPKAYEVVKYKGKAEGVTFALDFGDGYPEASHMRVTDRRGKTTPFNLDDSGEMRFVPRKQSDPKREIVLKMSMSEGPADKIEGTYTAGDKQILFTLRRVD